MIYLACDHRGFCLKEQLKKFLLDQGHQVEDVGALSYDIGDDYPDFAMVAAGKIAASPFEHQGIFLCGSGHGMDMIANKFRGIRAALCWNSAVAKQSREHDDANVLVLPADWLDEMRAQEIISVWFAARFLGEDRHIRRLKKIQETEEKNFRV